MLNKKCIGAAKLETTVKHERGAAFYYLYTE